MSRLGPRSDEQTDRRVGLRLVQVVSGMARWQCVAAIMGESGRTVYRLNVPGAGRDATT